MDHIRFLLLLLLFSPLFLATTYIVKENGTEVGRWEDKDGNDQIQVIENTKPQRLEKIKPPEPITGEPGYQWKKPPSPQGKVAEWHVSGQVIDLLHLKGLPSGKVVFSGHLQQVEAPVDFEGYFSAKLPQLENGAYMIQVEHFSGYSPHPFITHSGFFKKELYADRLLRQGSVPMSTGLKGDSYDIEIGLFPDQLTSKERDDYQKEILHRSGS